MKSALTFACTTVCLFAFAIGPTQVPAAVIADFQFDSGSYASSDPGTHWTTGDAGSGPGIDLGTDANNGQPSPSLHTKFLDLEPAGSGNKTLAQVIAEEEYYGFTVTPDANYEATFDELSVDVFKTGGAQFQYALLSSIDGFAPGLQIDGTKAFTLTRNWGTLTFDLSSLPSVEVPVEFRLYIIPNNYTVDSNDLNTDNILLTGTFQLVPEPGSLALFVAGLALLAVRSRWRRRPKAPPGSG